MINQDANVALQHIVIVGGGAGGLELAVRLGKKLGKTKKAIITLVDASPTHLWKPLLHQVAAGTMDSHADKRGYFALAHSHHFDFRFGRMDGLDRANKQLFLAPVLDEDGEEILPRSVLSYDSLVIALGSQTNDFGTPGAREHCIMLDTPVTAERFHHRLLSQCLRAQAQIRERGEGRFTVTIIGGGATGVELAAELHMTTKILSSYGLVNFHPEKELKIVIVDAAKRLLAMLPERVSTAAERELRSLDVQIYANEQVVEVSKEGVRMASGTFIPSGIVVWAAGIKAPDFLKELDGLETNRINQLVVTPTLQTSRDPAIFSIGDCSACAQGEGMPNVPPRAQSAHQQAELLARSLIRSVQGKSLLPFVYKDYGSLVSLGNYSTVGNLMGSLSSGSLFIEGTVAKIMYWSLHKHHQIVVNGWFHTWLTTWADLINRVKNPRIKLH
ncbi:NAD(P)/FAD-dependent oxidoreductase [Solimicrobium silvestre]|uniref:NADH dehydrogenase FAD-containing subunit n=1 Tax=Solimicrobium silvestre TaxID=2099400 RepID=A0A2S9H3R2_9BURK|nr:NAD(P)/FAD-dependent oxidoreductase [Solimicrobium silvestre]PRC94607.1 NADH dehydrogenase FAD-containing subunit [Solimicrobium silvestre]